MGAGCRPESEAISIVLTMTWFTVFIGFAVAQLFARNERCSFSGSGVLTGTARWLGGSFRCCRLMVKHRPSRQTPKGADRSGPTCRGRDG